MMQLFISPVTKQISLIKGIKRMVEEESHRVGVMVMEKVEFP